jgi:hypothetical protein
VGNRLLHPSQDGRDLNRISNKRFFSTACADECSTQPERITSLLISDTYLRSRFDFSC